MIQGVLCPLPVHFEYLTPQPTLVSNFIPNVSSCHRPAHRRVKHTNNRLIVQVQVNPSRPGSVQQTSSALLQARRMLQHGEKRPFQTQAAPPHSPSPRRFHHREMQRSRTPHIQISPNNHSPRPNPDHHAAGDRGPRTSHRGVGRMPPRQPAATMRLEPGKGSSGRYHPPTPSPLTTPAPQRKSQQRQL